MGGHGRVLYRLFRQVLAKYLPQTNHILWASERDGWNHLYLHDASTGEMVRQITRGEWLVRRVERVDVEQSRVLLKVAGIYPGQDPYYEHFMYASLTGEPPIMLTQGDGTHSIDFSPDGSKYLDRYSRVDMPTVNGASQCQGWFLVGRIGTRRYQRIAERWMDHATRFAAKGRDGVTDIYGVLFMPTHMDPNKKYPVIENIYAGPTGIATPKSWSTYHGNPQSLAEIGIHRCVD